MNAKPLIILIVAIIVITTTIYKGFAPYIKSAIAYAKERYYYNQLAKKNRKEFWQAMNRKNFMGV
ncbi:hypothetical protein ELBI_23 [Anabaena phage Elbi]|nr:hypothetical protein ELBI_23 [Anabaena phage Elbi]